MTSLKTLLWVAVPAFMVSLAGVSRASNLQSDFVLVIPKEIVRTTAPEFKGNFQTQMASVTVPGEFPVQLVNLVPTFDLQIKSLTPNLQGNFDFTAGLTNVRANIDSLHIDAVVERVVNGGVIRVRVKADCQNLVISGKAGVTVTGSGRLTNPLAVIFDDVQWTTDPNFWTVQAQSCVGPSDFIPFMEEKINEVWGTSVAFRSAILEEANSRISDWLNQRNSWTQNLSEFQTYMFIKASEFIDHDSAWIFRMDVDVNTVKPCKIFDTMKTTPKQTQFRVTQNMELSASMITVNAWAQCLHEMDTFAQKIYSTDLPGFRDLMDSWFKKWWVWPDLNRFPSEALFVFNTTTAGGISFASRQVSRPNPGSVYFDLSTNVRSAMRYVYRGQEYPYISFFTPVRATVEIKPTAGKYDKPSNLAVSFVSSPQLQTTYRFDVPRDQVSDPEIKLDYIQPEIAKVIAAQKYSFSVAPLPLTETRQVQMKGLRQASDALMLTLGLITDPSVGGNSGRKK